MCVLKACGMTRVEDAAAAVRLGYNAIGMILADSPRRVSPDMARTISRSLPSHILRVGVCVNPEGREVERLVRYCGLDLVQLHGDESPGEVARFGTRAIKALRLRGPDELDSLQDYPGVYAILLDAWDPVRRGGTGQACDWDLAALAAGRARVILAGGLTAANVGQAVERVRPFGVDVCSGVETSLGVKDHGMMRDFAYHAREAFSGITKEGAANARGSGP